MSSEISVRKSPDALRTISEASEELGVPQHVLRFWETRFDDVKPMKRAGRRRYYRPSDLELLSRIRDLLYRDGLTIKGVQKLFKDHRGRLPPLSLPPSPSSPPSVCDQALPQAISDNKSGAVAALADLLVTARVAPQPVPESVQGDSVLFSALQDMLWRLEKIRAGLEGEEKD